MDDSGDLTGDATLLARARTGDQAAFGALYDRHVRPVYWQAYGVVGEQSLAEEVTQDVFVTAWRRIGAIGLVDTSLLPWLLVTARYTALNARRGRARREVHHRELDDQVPARDSVEDEVAAGQVRAEIGKAVAALSETDRGIYLLCVEGDHSYEQAAAELGVSHAAVRNRLSRLRSRLRSDLRSIRETA